MRLPNFPQACLSLELPDGEMDVLQVLGPVVSLVEVPVGHVCSSGSRMVEPALAVTEGIG